MAQYTKSLDKLIKEIDSKENRYISRSIRCVVKFMKKLGVF